MMISPEDFIQKHIDKSYVELLRVREKLLSSILDFEKNGPDETRIVMYPSPGTIYQWNLRYLGKLCELISKKYNKEFV